MRLTAGQRLGWYEIVATLGSGGMGEVYSARDTRLDRMVAIKVLPARVAADPEARHGFEREARAIAALNHPNICTLHDIGTHDGTDFLVMEHVEGETLAARVQRGPLPPHEAVRYAIDIASALDKAHRVGLVHRDLKPGNIMLTDQGAKVLDFGLAKLVEIDPDMTRTVEGALVGTAAYMSPEQARARPVDPRSDAFSFGAVLYEMLTGRRAFGGDAIAQILTAVLNEEPPPIAAVPAIDAIVRRCLSKDPSQRFASMADVKRALEHVVVSAVPETPSIAVLPFANMSSDPENEFFGDGLAEEILNALVSIDGLRVAARTSSFSFKGKQADIAEIARRLSVRHVLEGSVRKAGNRVRVTVQLIDTSNGYHLWSERYDRELADIFDVQDDIARSVVVRLKIALGADATLVKAPTANMEAYELYLRSRAMLYKRGKWIAPALENFQRALALDPSYAQAWAGVADARAQLCFGGYARPRDTMPAALEAASRAVKLDPQSTEAHTALAYISLLWDRDFPKAERHFLEALRLNAHYVQARCWYGLFYLLWGTLRSDEGLTELRRALADDPLSAYVSACLSFSLSGVTRFEDAIAQARTAVDLDPDSFVAGMALGMARHWNGEYSEAIALLEPAYTSTQHMWPLSVLVFSYVRTGRISRTQAIYQSLLDRRTREYLPPFVLVACAAAIGDLDAAYRHCDEAVEEGDTQFAAWFEWWPDLDVVRQDPRFAEVRRRFNTGRTH